MTIHKTVDYDAIFNELKPGDTTNMLGRISNLEYLKEFRTITFGGGRQIGHTRWVEEQFISNSKCGLSDEQKAIVITTNKNFQSKFIQNLYNHGVRDSEIHDIVPYVFTLMDIISPDDLPPVLNGENIKSVYLDNVLRGVTSPQINRLYKWLCQNIKVNDAIIVSVING